MPIEEKKLVKQAQKINNPFIDGKRQSSQVTPRGIKKRNAASRAAQKKIDTMNKGMDKKTGGTKLERPSKDYAEFQAHKSDIKETRGEACIVESACDYVMTWGPHAGKKLSEIKSMSYFELLLAKSSVQGLQRKYVSEYLQNLRTEASKRFAKLSELNQGSPGSAPRPGKYNSFRRTCSGVGRIGKASRPHA